MFSIRIYVYYILKSYLEKESILNSYKIFLKSCDFNFQILIQSKIEDLNKHIKEINKLEEKVKTEPEKREAQKALASEVVRFLHGEEELQEAIKLTECLFTGNVKELTDEEIEMVFKGMPTIETKEDTIINIMTNNDIASSKREAREFLSNNAITLDGEIINDENYIITNNKKNHIIRRGKKKYYLIKIN